MEGIHFFENGELSTGDGLKSLGGMAAGGGMRWSSVLGPTLITPSGNKPTDEALAGKDKVAFLFGGQWCPWCAVFEPMMEDVYAKVKTSDPNDTEVVYLSVDESLEQFEKAIRGKPWCAVPFNLAQGEGGEKAIGFLRRAKREQTGKEQGVLAKKYKIESVPSVIVCDGKSGLVNAANIKTELGEEPEDGLEFNPRTPASWLDALEEAGVDWSKILGPSLITPSGEKPTKEALKGKKQVALIFAGQWCPWCRKFDPMLQEAYSKLQAMDPSDTEMVYMSVDADDAAFQEAMKGKPWCAIPWTRAQGENGEAPLGFIRKAVREKTGKAQGRLGSKYGIGSVPSVVVLDGSDGKLVAENITRDLGDKPDDGMEFNEKAPLSWLKAMKA